MVFVNLSGAAPEFTEVHADLMARWAEVGKPRCRNGSDSSITPDLNCNWKPESAIARQEIFGPVICVTPFDTEAESIIIANGTEFGLAAGVFTRDLDRARRSTRAMRAVQVFVNEWFADGIATPFGGAGKSGFGRENGIEAQCNYVRTKSIAIRPGA